MIGLFCGGVGCAAQAYVGTIANITPETQQFRVRYNATQPAGGSTVSEVLSGLRAGRSAGVKVVGSEAELTSLFGRLSAGGKSVSGTTYPGKVVKLPDGSILRLRQFSTSGGPTIDFTPVGGTIIKVHIEPWP